MPLPRFDRPLSVSVREARLLTQAPWVRPIGRLTLEVTTQGWRFPSPAELLAPPRPRLVRPDEEPESPAPAAQPPRGKTRLRPPSDAVQFKDRLLYLLQPPLEDLFGGKQVHLPFPAYPYQIQGIAFLMPRHAALLADEMGLGKTAQVIIALRLLFHAGAIHRALVVCPKPLVINWTRELRIWAEDVPFEVVGGDTRGARGGLVRLELSGQAGQLRAAHARCRAGLPTSGSVSTWSCWTRRSGSRTASPRPPRWSAACTATAAGP